LKCFKVIVFGAFVCAEEKGEDLEWFHILLFVIYQTTHADLPPEKRQYGLTQRENYCLMWHWAFGVHWSSLVSYKKFILPCLREKQCE
jgi:hypothetical protein